MRAIGDDEYRRLRPQAGLPEGFGRGGPTRAPRLCPDGPHGVRRPAPVSPDDTRNTTHTISTTGC
jgi:hypothetical protein